MERALLYLALSIILGPVSRWAISRFSSSDPRSSISKGLKKLERTSQRVQATIHDEEKREIRGEAVKLRLEELKQVAYEAEDVLKKCHYEELRAQVEGRASRKRKRVEGGDEEEVSASLSTIVVPIPDGMRDRIREIGEWLDEIWKDRKRLRLREEDGERRILKAPYLAPATRMAVVSSIYGAVDVKRKVVDLLFSEAGGNGISVISIVSEGGLETTTIAKLVYSEAKQCLWVCVSDDFDLANLASGILYSLLTFAPPSTLQDTRKEEVKGKRVLLVIWNGQPSRWEPLGNPLVAIKGTMIVTCTNDSVSHILVDPREEHLDNWNE